MRVLKFALVVVLAWLLSGCASLLPPEPTSTPTETPLPTATPTRKPTPLPPTATLTPTPTATIMPTIVPINGQVNAPTNVRSRPSKSGDIFGGVYYPGIVHVIGRNDNATWLWIIFGDSPTGTGWVVLKAIDLLPDDLGKLPIVVFPPGGAATQVYPPLIYAITGAPLPVNMPVAGSRTATVLQLLNVRVGPGVGYSMMGSIQAGTLLTVTGSIADNEWLQIEYPSGPDGRAWVLGNLVKINDDISALPVYNLLGTIAPTSDGSVPNEIPASTDEGLGSGLFDSTPLATVTAQAPQAEVTNQINVRSGPASKFKSLGIVNPGLKVNLTGLTLNGLWYQIEYANSPDGHGWVAAGFIKILGDTRHLYYFDNSGTPLPTPKP